MKTSIKLAALFSALSVAGCDEIERRGYEVQFVTIENDYTARNTQELSKAVLDKRAINFYAGAAGEFYASGTLRKMSSEGWQVVGVVPLTVLDESLGKPTVRTEKITVILQRSK